MKHLILLLVFATALSAAESDAPKALPEPTPPLVTGTSAATSTDKTAVLPVKPACCCEASGGRAGMLARALAAPANPTSTTSTPVSVPVPVPAPVVSPSP